MSTNGTELFINVNTFFMPDAMQVSCGKFTALGSNGYFFSKRKPTHKVYLLRQDRDACALEGEIEILGPATLAGKNSYIKLIKLWTVKHLLCQISFFPSANNTYFPKGLKRGFFFTEPYNSAKCG
jgi:hypothetical protein